MARTSLIRLSVLGILLRLLTACSTGENHPHNPVLLKGAGYALQINDTSYYTHPDVLYRRLLPRSFGETLHKDHLPLPETIHWFFPGKGTPYVLALSRPGTPLPLNRLTSEKYQGKTFYRTDGARPLWIYTTDSVSVLTDRRDAVQKYIRGGFMPIRESEKELIRKNRNDEAYAQWYVRPSLIPDGPYQILRSPTLQQYNGRLWIWDVEAPGQQQFSGTCIPHEHKASLAVAFTGNEPGGKALVDKLNAYAQYTAVFFESFPVWEKHWSDFKKSAGYSTAPFLPGRYKSVKSWAYIPSKSPVIILYTLHPGRFTDSLSPSDEINGLPVYANPDSTRLPAFLFPLARKSRLPYLLRKDHYILMGANPDILLQSLINWNDSGSPATDIPQELRQSDFHILHRDGNRWMGFYYDDRMTFQTYYAGSGAAQTGHSATSGRSQLLFRINWPAEITYGPQWIYNHRSRRYELLFQDNLNRLVLVDARGKVRWKKNIDMPILGRIRQVDMFRNGKRQFLFATSDGVYIMDIRGTYVAPFPLHLPVEGPIGLFDYERNRHYRIAVPTGHSLRLYDIHGKPVKGFQPDSLIGPLQSAPQHLRLAGKDYIFLHQTGGKLLILNRRGKIRIPVRKPVPSADGRWYVYRNRFITLSNDGRLLSLTPAGKSGILWPGVRLSEIQVRYGHLIGRTTDGKAFVDGKPVDRIPSQPVGILRRNGRTVFCFTGRNQSVTGTPGHWQKLPYALRACSPDGRLLSTDGQEIRVFGK